MDSRFEIAVVSSKEEIYNTILNPQVFKQANIHDVEKENSERPPSNKEIIEVLSVFGKSVQTLRR